MSDLKIIGKQNVANVTFTGIEGGFSEGKKAMLVKEIAEIHGKQIKHITLRINENRTRFKEGVDIVDLKASPSNGLSFEELGFSKQAVANSRNIYLLSERGYAKLLKILEDDKAWEIYDELVDSYFNMRSQLDTSNLSPELQMFNGLFQSLAKQELAHKQLEMKVEGIRDVVALNTIDWRKDSAALINKMALKLGGYEHIRALREESYRLLDERINVCVKTRLTNKRRRMADEGVCKSKRDKLNPLDVIADDKKLITGYVSVIKDMAIKYGLDVPA